jgi:hypothetical protein
MALKTCATNNNLHPKGFFLGANLVCHTHACCSYVSFGLEDDSSQFARICLVIVYNKNTIYLRKLNPKKELMQKAWQFLSQCIHFPRMLYLGCSFIPPSYPIFSWIMSWFHVVGITLGLLCLHMGARSIIGFTL